jgi:hypothetical protein
VSAVELVDVDCVELLDVDCVGATVVGVRALTAVVLTVAGVGGVDLTVEPVPVSWRAWAMATDPPTTPVTAAVVTTRRLRHDRRHRARVRGVRRAALGTKTACRPDVRGLCPVGKSTVRTAGEGAEQEVLTPPSRGRGR